MITNLKEELDKELSSKIDAQIWVLIGLGSFVLVYLIFVTRSQSKFIMEPLNNLIEDSKAIENFQDMDIDLSKGFKESYYEVNELKDRFQTLNVILKYSTDEYFQGSDAEQIIKYANALDLFQKTNSLIGQGISYNNIGNLHSKNGRIQEAIDNYSKALAIAEKEFLQEVKCQHIHVFYKIKPLKGWDSISNQLNRYQFLQTDAYTKKGTVWVNQRKKQILEEIFSNRLYNLSLALMKQAKIVQYPAQKLKIWEQVIDNLMIITKIDGQRDKKISREIKAYIYLCESYYEREEILEKNVELNPKQTQSAEDDNLAQALIKLNQAEDKLQAYEQVYKLFLEEEKLDDPAVILQQQIILLKGLIHQYQGLDIMACNYFIASLEWGNIYANDIRNKSLLNLQEIFTRRNLIDKAKHIPRMIKENQRKKNKDIIFLLDFSDSMKYGRYKHSLKTFLKIYDNYIEPEDRLAFVIFNQNVNVIFELNEMNKNTNFYRDQIINTQNIDPNGETAFYQSLYESTKLFNKVPNKNNRKWIIALTDGDDTCSTMTSQKMGKILKKQKIGLIVIGIALNRVYSEQLNDLCAQSRDGAFIQSANSENLDIALQSISNLLHEITVLAEGFITESFR